MASLDPHREVLNRFLVDKIFLNKIPTPSEHEYLLIDTHDTEDNLKSRLFILDCTVARDSSVETEITTKTNTETKETILTPEFETLSTTDNISVSTTQASDIVSDENNTTACDRLLGESAVYSPEWAGQNVRYFKPNRLTLFELALLANVVHEEYPIPTIRVWEITATSMPALFMLPPMFTVVYALR